MNRKILFLILFAVLVSGFYQHPLSPAKAEAPRLMGVNSFDADTTLSQANLDLIASSGGNVVEQQLCYEIWADNASYRAHWIDFVDKVHDAGLQFILSCYSTVPSPPEGWGQMKYDAVYVTAKRNAWINGFATIIDALLPEGVAIMNEPEDVIVPYDLKQFYLSCVDHWVTHKADLFFVIQGAPWWDIGTILTSPRVDVQRPSSTFYYATHYYYSYLNEVPQPSWGHPEMIDYWNGNLGPAQTELYNYYNNGCGVQAALSLGLNVMFEEFGTHILNPNYDQFMNDTFTYAESYGISVLWVGWWENDYTQGSFAGTGMIDDYTPTLNDIGDIWAGYMAGYSDFGGYVLEDFTTFSESDTGSYITIVNSTYATFTDYTDDEDCYLVKQYDESFFSPNFSARIELNSTTNTGSGLNCKILTIANGTGIGEDAYGMGFYFTCNSVENIGSFTLFFDFMTEGSGSAESAEYEYNSTAIYLEFIYDNAANTLVLNIYMDEYINLEESLLVESVPDVEAEFTYLVIMKPRTGMGTPEWDGFIKNLYVPETEPSDTEPPTYSTLTYSGTITGSIVKFTVTANDNVTLGYAIFTTNSTGSWQPTTITFTATPQQANVSKVLTSTPSVKVGYRWYIFDTSGNVNDTGIHYLTTTYVAQPVTPPAAGSPGGLMVTVGPTLMLIFLVGTALVLVSSKRNLYERKIQLQL